MRHRQSAGLQPDSTVQLEKQSMLTQMGRTIFEVALKRNQFYHLGLTSGTAHEREPFGLAA